MPRSRIPPRRAALCLPLSISSAICISARVMMRRQSARATVPTRSDEKNKQEEAVEMANDVAALRTEFQAYRAFVQETISKARFSIEALEMRVAKLEDKLARHSGVPGR